MHFVGKPCADESVPSLNCLIGFGDRVLSEVKRLAPQKDVKLKIYAPPERKVRSMDDL